MKIEIVQHFDFYGDLRAKLEAINLIFFGIITNENAYYSIAWNQNAPNELPNYLKYLCHIHTIITVIETNKLLNASNSESFNLYSLFNYIKLYDVHKVFEQDKIREFSKTLKSHKDIINEVKLLRKKRYAHLDRDFKKNDNFFSQRKFRQLTDDLKHIIDYLNRTFNLPKHLRYETFKGYSFGQYYDSVFKKLSL